MVVVSSREQLRAGAEPGERLRAGAEPGERSARRDLRDQIARLEAQLARTAASAWPDVDLRPFAQRRAGPRLLTLGELEAVRDELADRVAAMRAQIASSAERQEGFRVLIERMLIDPGAHKWVRVTNADIGEPGCRSWHVRPRLGLVGMLAGWWHVKISSGCPLSAAAGGRARWADAPASGASARA